MASIARVEEELLSSYRKWAEASGRSLQFLIAEALQFGLEKQSEIERRIAARVQQKGA